MNISTVVECGRVFFSSTNKIMRECVTPVYLTIQIRPIKRRNNKLVLANSTTVEPSTA